MVVIGEPVVAATRGRREKGERARERERARWGGIQKREEVMEGGSKKKQDV
jgi:hypothetical protein